MDSETETKTSIFFFCKKCFENNSSGLIQLILSIFDFYRSKQYMTPSRYFHVLLRPTYI